MNYDILEVNTKTIPLLNIEQWLMDVLFIYDGIIAIYFLEVRKHCNVYYARTYHDLRGPIITWCRGSGIHCKGFGFGKVSKFITGKSNVTKQSMLEAIIELRNYPENDREVRALALMHYVKSDLKK